MSTVPKVPLRTCAIFQLTWFSFFEFDLLFPIWKVSKALKKSLVAFSFLAGFPSLCFHARFGVSHRKIGDGNAKIWKNTKSSNLPKSFFSMHVVVFGFLSKTVNMQIGWWKPNCHKKKVGKHKIFLGLIHEKTWKISLTINQISTVATAITYFVSVLQRLLLLHLITAMSRYVA